MAFIVEIGPIAWTHLKLQYTKRLQTTQQLFVCGRIM